MERWVGADRAQVEAHGAFSHGTHRVVDPADPPRDLSGWAWGVYVSLGVLAILDVVQTAAALDLRSEVTGYGDVLGSYHDYSRWTGLYGLMVMVSAGVFIAWFFQAYKNLRRLGVGNLTYGNGWAIGSWFVPILGMIRPKQIANEIWRGSERGVDVAGGWKQGRVPGLLHWWWGLFLAQGLFFYIGQRTAASGYEKLSLFGEVENGLSQIKTGTTLDVIGGLLGLVAIALAIRVVSLVTDRFAQIGGEAIAQASLYPQAPQYAPAPAAQYPQAAAVMAYPQSQPPPPPPTEQRVQCPDCAEWIQAEANVCRFCGHRLRPLGQ